MMMDDPEAQGRGRERQGEAGRSRERQGEAERESDEISDSRLNRVGMRQYDQIE